jgi:hypothetical protein
MVIIRGTMEIKIIGMMTMMVWMTQDSMETDQQKSLGGDKTPSTSQILPTKERSAGLSLKDQEESVDC